MIERLKDLLGKEGITYASIDRMTRIPPTRRSTE
jgi:hypothetical protein